MMCHSWKHLRFLYVLVITKTALISSSSSSSLSSPEDVPFRQLRRAADSLLTGGVYSKLENAKDRELRGHIQAYPFPVHTLTEHEYGQRQGTGHAMMMMRNPNWHSSRHGRPLRAHHGVRARPNLKHSGGARAHSHQYGRTQGMPRPMATEKKRMESSAQGAGRKMGRYGTRSNGKPRPTPHQRAHRSGPGGTGGPQVESGGRSSPEGSRPRHQFESRIVGGFEAESGAFKFFASLDVGCGGSLIAPNMVLTAAHCGGSTVGTVRVGSDDYLTGGVTRSATSQCLHPMYTFDNDDYDFMLVMLDQPVDTTEYPLIELNQDRQLPEEDDMLTVIGFGLTTEDGEGSQKLLQVDVPMNSFDQCNEQYEGTINDDIQFCAGYIEGGKDSCQGDSGGPIFELRGTVPVQVGVVSFGEGCARPDRSGVYARVSSAIDWIHETVLKLSAGDLSGCSGGSLGDDEGVDNLFEGDIVPDYESIFKAYGPDVAEELVRTGRMRMNENDANITQRQADINRRWDTRVNGVVQVPYQFSGQHSAEAMATIENAMQELADRSKVVKFVPRTVESDYILIVDGIGCSSFVGKQGGGQQLTLQSDGCVWHGTVQHEFLHALGFNHEQSRPDRDDFVKINFENVIPDQVHNFDKRIESDNLGSPYDYGSVMHYGKTDFTVNGFDTITAPQSIGQREAADDIDIHQVVLLYQCPNGARSEEEFLANPCSEDCPCWEGATGCNGNSLACFEGLSCNESNQCVVGAPVTAPVPSPVTPPVPSPVTPPVPSPVTPPSPSPVAAPVPSPVTPPVPSPVTFPFPSPVAAPVPSPVGGDDDGGWFGGDDGGWFGGDDGGWFGGDDGGGFGDDDGGWFGGDDGGWWGGDDWF